MAKIPTIRITDMSNHVMRVKMMITVQVTKEFRIRMAVAAWLIGLGARVLKCGIEFVDADGEDT